MKTLYIVGLGTGNINELSREACLLLEGGFIKHARTLMHPIFREHHFTRLNSFDNLFEKSESIEQVYDDIYKVLSQDLLIEEKVVYLVPGSPYDGDDVSDRFMQLIQENLEIKVIDAQGFLEKAIKLSRSDRQSLKILAAEACDYYNLDFNTDTIICNIENTSLASNVKIELSAIYPDSHPLKMIDVLTQKVIEIPLFELDRQKNFYYSTYIFVESIENSMTGLYNINDLKKVMSFLRGPDGCPWDRKQTHKSLRECVIEEAHEVVDAIENDDVENLIEELGDLLLQVVFHARIAFEEGDFTFEDITSRICQKLYARHPHVFGDKKASGESEALMNWDEIKKHEKNITATSEKMTGITKSLPPLTRAYKIQKAAASVGFDWPDISGAIYKIKEEIEELMEAYASLDQDHTEEELGDLLFAIVNFARFLKINPDIALGRTNEKFIHRFKYIEAKAHKSLQDMTLEEMDELWEISKRH